MTDATVTQADLRKELIAAIYDGQDGDWTTHETADEIMLIFARHRTRAAEDMRERCAVEAEAWFPADTATRYPAGGIVRAIRALPTDTPDAP